MGNGWLARRMAKFFVAIMVTVFVAAGCKPAQQNVTVGVVPSYLSNTEIHELRNLLSKITNSNLSDTFLIKHYHNYDDCWSTSRYMYRPDVLGNIKRLQKWLNNFEKNNPTMNVLQVRQPGSGALRIIKRNYDVKVDTKKELLQFAMFGKHECNIVWLVFPNGYVRRMSARYIF
jgi:hypothetical protein